MASGGVCVGGSNSLLFIYKLINISTTFAEPQRTDSFINEANILLINCTFLDLETEKILIQAQNHYSDLNDRNEEIICN